MEPYCAGPDHSRILIEQGEQFWRPVPDQDSLSDAQDKGQSQADPNHPIHSFPFPSTQVLADEGHARLMERIHGNVQEILDAGTCAVGRHYHTAKEIDGSLDHHIGQAEEHGLDCSRYADPGNFLQGFPIQQEPMPMVMERASFPSQAAEHQNRRNQLAEHSGQPHTGHIPVENNDEKQIQEQIQESAGQEEIQRPPGITHRPEHRGPVIILEDKGRAQKIDLEIKASLGEDIYRRPHPFQDPAGSQESPKGQEDSANGP